MITKCLPISKNEIHLWLVKDQAIDDSDLLRQYSGWMSESESTQWQRFHFAKDRHQYLVTRALVRYALSCYSESVDMPDWRFKTNEYGRPSVANPQADDQSIVFNISHTQGLIALALCRQGELGVDVEYVGRRGTMIDLAERYFSMTEVVQLRELPKLAQRNRFFDLWTLKEAYIKARGMGLSIPLDQFSFSFPSEATVGLQMSPSLDDQPLGWQLWQLASGAKHKIAIAYRSTLEQAPVKLMVSAAVPGRSLAPIQHKIFRSS